MRRLVGAVAVAAGLLPAPNAAPATGATPSGVAGCTISGTAGDDVMRGTPSADVICGLQGDDAIRGLCVATEDGVGGNDVANGGAGRDAYDADDGDVLVRVERSAARASSGG